MASLGDLPELVRDSRLQTTVRDTETIHTRPSARRNISRHERWLMKEIIGHGGGGVVWLQRRVEGSGPVELRAVKCIKTGADIDTTLINKRFVRELEASAKFSQEKYAEHFVRSYGWYDSPGWLNITMEYCPHGDLGTYLRSKPLPEDQVQDIAIQLLEGLILMHTEGFAHRDLKPSNILIVTKPPEEGWWVKMCDLGLSRRSGDASGSTTVRGTPEFMAPETIGHPFDGDPTTADPMRADIWCLGETIARALTGRTTFDILSLLKYQRAGIDFPESTLRSANVSQEAIQFLRSLMKAQAAARPDAISASRLPWISSKADIASIYAEPSSQSPAIRSQFDWPMGGSGLSSNGTLSSRSTTSIPPTQLTQESGQWTTTLPLRDLITKDVPSQSSEQSPPIMDPVTSIRPVQVQPKNPDVHGLKQEINGLQLMTSAFKQPQANTTDSLEALHASLRVPQTDDSASESETTKVFKPKQSASNIVRRPASERKPPELPLWWDLANESVRKAHLAEQNQPPSFKTPRRLPPSASTTAARTPSTPTRRQPSELPLWWDLADSTVQRTYLNQGGHFPDSYKPVGLTEQPPALNQLPPPRRLHTPQKETSSPPPSTMSALKAMVKLAWNK